METFRVDAVRNKEEGGQVGRRYMFFYYAITINEKNINNRALTRKYIHILKS